MPDTQIAETKLVAELNDLLQLDHDAIQSYTLAIPALENVGRRQTVIRFREDHERHVAELTALVKAHGGLPIELPHPTGVAKLATQAAGNVGGDREVLIAFKANERQARDKYAAALKRLAGADEGVLAVVRRGADDEARHYEWAEETLRGLGVTSDGPIGRVSQAFEVVHARTAEAVETVGRQGMRGFEAARRAVRRPGSGRAIVAALAVVGVGIAIAGMRSGGGRSRKRGRRWG
jgi:rubrerythrin